MTMKNFTIEKTYFHRTDSRAGRRYHTDYSDIYFTGHRFPFVLDIGLASIVAPEDFSADIMGDESMDLLIRQVIPFLKREDADERPRLGNCLVLVDADLGNLAYWKYSIWAAFPTHCDQTAIPYSHHQSVDEKSGLAGFVLESKVLGRGVREGVYTLKRKGRKLSGKLIEFEATQYDMNTKQFSNHFKHKISNPNRYSPIREGRLYYSVIYTDFTGNGKSVPWKPQIRKRRMAYNFDLDQREELSDRIYRK